MLAGNLVALFFSAMITAAVSWMYPQDFDWALLKEIPMVDQDPNEDIMAGEDSPEELTKALHAVWWWGGVLTLVLIIIWPCLALPIKVFNKTYWEFWVFIVFAWAMMATIASVLLPIWEARETFMAVFSGLKGGKQGYTGHAAEVKEVALADDK